MQARSTEEFQTANKLLGMPATLAKKAKKPALVALYNSLQQPGSKPAVPKAAGSKAAAWTQGGAAPAAVKNPAAQGPCGQAEVAAAVAEVAAANPAMGVKKMVRAADSSPCCRAATCSPALSARRQVAEVKKTHPELEAGGATVGAKEVKLALAALKAGGVRRTAPPAPACSDSVADSVRSQAAVDGGGGGGGGGAFKPRDGLLLTVETAFAIFGVRTVAKGKTSGKAEIEAGNKQYKVLSAGWRSSASPEGACRTMVFAGKTPEDW